MSTSIGSPLSSFGDWQTRHGDRFRYEHWASRTTRSTGQIILVHGLNGAMQDFEPFLARADRLGLDVYAYDLRAQGGDPVQRRRGDLANWQAWIDDLEDFAVFVRSQSGNEKPLFLYGESLGALIAARAEPAIKPAGTVLSAPVVKFKQDRPVTVWQRWLIRFTFFAAPWYRLDIRNLSNPNDPKPMVTRDQIYQQHTESAPYQVHRCTLRFYRNLIFLVENSASSAAHLRGPVLVLAAGQDIFVRPQDVTDFFTQIPGSNKTLHVYPDDYHLLIRDLGADRVLNDIEAWLARRLHEEQ